MNIKNIKMFFFDNDSTLFDHKYGTIRPKTIEAIKLLKQNGYKLCMNTSRSYEEMYNVPKEVLDLMDCLILLNGAYIVKGDDVEVSYLDKEHVKKAVEYCDENNLTYRFCTDDGGGFISHDDEYRQLFFDLYNMKPPIKKYEGEDVIHLLVYSTHEQSKEIIQIFSEEESAPLTRVLEISPKGCNKGSAMLKVAKEYGYDPEELCAVGDSNNDYDMLKYAGLGIAMGNYSGRVNEVADYITDDIGEEGLYNAMKHFEFI